MSPPGLPFVLFFSSELPRKRGGLFFAVRGAREGQEGGKDNRAHLREEEEEEEKGKKEEKEGGGLIRPSDVKGLRERSGRAEEDRLPPLPQQMCTGVILPLLRAPPVLPRCKMHRVAARDCAGGSSLIQTEVDGEGREGGGVEGCG